MSKLVKNGNSATLKAGTSINAKNSKEIKDQLRQAFEEGVDRIIVDMSETEIIDSIGLGLLVATHNTLKSRNTKLELINVKENILKVINLMRLDRYFIITNTDNPS